MCLNRFTSSTSTYLHVGIFLFHRLMVFHDHLTQFLVMHRFHYVDAQKSFKI